MELSRTPWKSDFSFICVDPGPTRPQLPGWLKKVPTIVIAGETEPRTDGEVMNWLYEKKMKDGGGGGGAEGFQGGGAGSAAGEPAAFSLAENVSFAKGFSYSGLDVDTSSQGSGGFTMPGAFSFLNGAASDGDRMSQAAGHTMQGASLGSNPKRSKKEELFDKQMEAYQKEREMGMPKGPGRI